MVLAAAVDASHCALRACTGNVEISAFQTLSVGKTWHVVVGGAAAAAGTVPRTTAASKGRVNHAWRADLQRIPH